ncbi:DUF309 domain-containing protein [Jeotgalibacillus sp. R-1-5s-1]|uniref:DUF309 domain-containing protein n=1 Tax=Jeotgalibacillus sp. R-1-5s-1 TaxID=2555897 RepID=UPI00141BB1A3|nr:DUF309 domain-containing protein [Jeotgalibacillus sp. R-1-5s-1]
MKNYDQAYLDYLIHFHGDRDYFECHEVLEEYWKECTAQEKDSVWAGLIQFATGLYHYRRGNLRGAAKSIHQAHGKLSTKTDQLAALGIEHEAFIQIIIEIESAIAAATPYQSVMIPLNDSALESYCKQECAQKGFAWGKPSDVSNPELINRHTLRDRSEVIALRQKALREKNN